MSNAISIDFPSARDMMPLFIGKDGLFRFHTLDATPVPVLDNQSLICGGYFRTSIISG